jgi:hypothetical protein
MGSHAVRYYGLRRYTNNFDFTLAPEGWDDLGERLARSGLESPARPSFYGFLLLDKTVLSVFN